MGFWTINTTNINTTDFDSLGLHITRNFSGIGLPPMQQNMQSYALLPGSVYQNTKILPRTLMLEVDLEGSSYANMTELHATLCEYFLPDTNSISIPVTITYDDNTTRMSADFYYVSGLEWLGYEGFGQKIPLQLVAPDPAWYEDGQTVQRLTLSNNLQPLPLRAVRGESIEQDAPPIVITDVVTPRGSAPTYPVITLELDDGAATIFSIENETTGQALNFDRLTLQAGEVITIDLKRGRKSIVSSQLGSLRRTLLPGSQLADFCLSGKQANTLTVTTDNPALIVTFSMPIAHLSIGGGAR